MIVFERICHDDKQGNNSRAFQTRSGTIPSGLIPARCLRGVRRTAAMFGAPAFACQAVGEDERGEAARRKNEGIKRTGIDLIRQVNRP